MPIFRQIQHDAVPDGGACPSPAFLLDLKTGQTEWKCPKATPVSWIGLGGPLPGDLLDDAHIVVRRQGMRRSRGLIHDCGDIGFCGNVLLPFETP